MPFAFFLASARSDMRVEYAVVFDLLSLHALD